MYVTKTSETEWLPFPRTSVWQYEKFPQADRTNSQKATDNKKKIMCVLIPLDKPTCTVGAFGVNNNKFV